MKDKYKERTESMIRIVLMALLIMSLMASAVMASDVKDAYRPSWQEYPQVIQDFDYTTIRAIEALYAEVSRLGEGPVSCTADDSSILFRSIKDPRKQVLISVPQNGPVAIGDTSYPEPETVTFFTTFRKILSDLTASHTCSGMQSSQFGTRGYEKRTILEFDFGEDIVELEAFSNGPDDEERLYVLDIVSRTESFFFSH